VGECGISNNIFLWFFMFSVLNVQLATVLGKIYILYIMIMPQKNSSLKTGFSSYLPRLAMNSWAHSFLTTGLLPDPSSTSLVCSGYTKLTVHKKSYLEIREPQTGLC
jgi:hypothetical protein